MRRAVLIDITQPQVLDLTLLVDEVEIIHKKYQGQHPDILFSLDKFIKQNNLKLDKISYLVLLEGQGSFSGVRQAAAILNTIHLIKKINIFGLDVRKYPSREQIIRAIQKEARKKHGFLKPIYSGEPNITYPSNKK